MKWYRFHSLLALTLVVAAACGGGGQVAAETPSPTPTWLTFDATAKTVKLTIISSYNSDNAGFNFNGYDTGKMVVSVPTGWQVTVDCENRGTGNHSCAIVKNGGDQTPAFPGAATDAPAQGFPSGAFKSFTFTTGATGTYRISCLVPGHDANGMWDTFKVTDDGQPQITFG